MSVIFLQRQRYYYYLIKLLYSVRLVPIALLARSFDILKVIKRIFTLTLLCEVNDILNRWKSDLEQMNWIYGFYGGVAGAAVVRRHHVLCLIGGMLKWVLASREEGRERMSERLESRIRRRGKACRRGVLCAMCPLLWATSLVGNVVACVRCCSLAGDAKLRLWQNHLLVPRHLYNSHPDDYS